MVGLVDPNSVQDAAAGAPLQAALLDALRTAVMYLGTNKAHLRAYKSTSLSVSNNTETAITLDTERVDVGATHSTSSNTARYTVPTGEGGFHLSEGGVQWASNSAGVRALIIRLNGTTHLRRERVTPINGDVTEQSLATLYQLAAADYLELCGFQTSGGSLNAVAGTNYSPEFAAIWLGT